MLEHANSFPGRNLGSEDRDECQEVRDARRSRPPSTWSHRAFVRPSAIKGGGQERRGGSAAVVTMNGMRMAPAASSVSLVAAHASACTSAQVLVPHLDAPLAVGRPHSSAARQVPAPAQAGWCTQRSDFAGGGEDGKAGLGLTKDLLLRPLPLTYSGAGGEREDEAGYGGRGGSGHVQAMGAAALHTASHRTANDAQHARPNTATHGGGGGGAGRPRNHQMYTRLVNSTATFADRERLRFGTQVALFEVALVAAIVALLEVELRRPSNFAPH